ncbi:MAG: DNA polymerase I, partial [Endozoicomonadaceae bacterium]|nr:DNA polymerase I [Endozoicomonadaceae bacterium]
MSTQGTPDVHPEYILVDGSSYLYRAFHALPPLSTSTGEPTWVVRGVISMIRKLMEDYPQSNVVTVFDAKGKSFRNDIYPEYKANRPPMPDDLRCQIEPLHSIIKLMGLPLIMHEGVEADDVIGTLAIMLTNTGKSVLISTGDKDMAQLVSDHITLIDTMKNKHLNRAGVEEKFGVPPELIIDLLALQGDKSDNIPGVPKVGEKTAQALLQAIGGLDAIYNNIDAVAKLKIRGAASLAERLQTFREQAFLSYDLATIRTQLALNITAEMLKKTDPDNDQLLNWYKKLEFRSWIKVLEKTPDVTDSEDQPTAPAVVYETITDKAALLTWIERLRSAAYFSFDTETTSLNYMQAELVGVSFAVNAKHAAYIPLGHDYPEAPEQLDRAWVLEQLKPLLEDPHLPKAGQHLKYDKNVLARYSINLQGIAFDTMLESYVLNATATRHDMDSLARYYLDTNTVKYEDVAGKGAKQQTFNQIDIAQAAPYAAEDADITLRLHQTLWPKLQADKKLAGVYESIEKPLINVLSSIEQMGALIDTKQLAQQTQELKEHMHKLEQTIHQLAGEEFNVNSTKQLQTILFEKQGLPVRKKTPKGQPSTAEEVLEELALDYPLPKRLLEFRRLNKLCTTYTDKLPKMVNPDTGRLHTSYHQAITTTGRLSSTDPNLQNIPVRTPEGRRVRQAFIAPQGYRLIAADYSQIELRIMAHLSQDEGLLEAFAKDLDIHSATAAEIFSVSPDAVTKEQRRSAKAINFGLIYGMSAFGLAKQLGISRPCAQEYIDVYFQRYPGVKRYMDEIKENARSKGYVETLCGRRLYLNDIKSNNA